MFPKLDRYQTVVEVDRLLNGVEDGAVIAIQAKTLRSLRSLIDPGVEYVTAGVRADGERCTLGDL